MNLAICVIAYNRLESLKRCLNSLSNASYSQQVKLYISVDKSDTDIIENFAKDFQWNYGRKEVILHNTNFGLRKHVLSCGNLLKEHDALIVLEDDIVVSPSFFSFASQCVEKYNDDKRIAGISLYNFPITYHSQQPFSPMPSNSDVYLMQNAQSWGQVWMKSQWMDFMKWYADNNEEFTEQAHLPKSICRWPKSSWLKYHTKYCIEQNKYFIYPYQSHSTCFAEVGVHTKNISTIFQTPLVLDNTIVDYRLTPTVIYDSFFENNSIYEWLNISITNLCLDYYGDRNNRERKRYWLTRKQLPFKILKSYGLTMKPYEMNVFNNISGNDLFLYDTRITENREVSDIVSDRQFYYMYGTNRVTKQKIFNEHFGIFTKPIMWEMKIICILRKLKKYLFFSK